MHSLATQRSWEGMDDSLATSTPRQALAGKSAKRMRMYPVVYERIVKYFDVHLTVAAVGPDRAALGPITTGSQVADSLVNIAQGGLSHQRVGQTVQLLSVEWLLNVIPVVNSATVWSPYYIIIYYDECPKGTLPSATDLLSQTTSPGVAYKNPNNENRFKFLCEKHMALPQVATDAAGQTTDIAGGTGAYVVIDPYKVSTVIKGYQALLAPKYTVFDSNASPALANIKSGVLNIAAFSSDAVATWKVVGTVRVTFEDVE